MLYYLDYLFLVLFWTCTLYALKAYYVNPRDPKNKHVFLVFLFSSIAFTFASPIIAQKFNKFLGISSISRPIENISSLIALYSGYLFFTDFAPEKKKRVPWLTFYLFLVTAALISIFSLFLSKPQLEPIFLGEDTRNLSVFIYSLVLQSLFLPLFAICALNFYRYARLVKEQVTRVRLYSLSIGCLMGASGRILELVYWFDMRYFAYLKFFGFPVVIRIINLFMVLFLYAGFIMPAFLRKIVESFGELLGLRQTRYNLISLLALINDARSFLHSDNEMINYVRRLCEKFSLSLEETAQAVESARIISALAGKTDQNSTMESAQVFHSAAKYAAAAFAEEIKFYDQVYKNILYAKERYDGKDAISDLNGDKLPMGSRIIKVVDCYFNSNLFPFEAVKVLKEGANKEFDPEVVKAFIEILEEEKTSIS